MPGTPSAVEMSQDGVSVSQMCVLLLEKVEETHSPHDRTGEGEEGVVRGVGEDEERKISEVGLPITRI